MPQWPWPHVKYLIATGDKRLTSWIAQMSDISVTAASLVGQPWCADILRITVSPQLFGANCIFPEPSTQDGLKPLPGRLWRFVPFGAPRMAVREFGVAPLTDRMRRRSAASLAVTQPDPSGSQNVYQPATGVMATTEVAPKIR